MKIATITFAHSSKRYDYVITKNSSPVIAGKEYNIVIGASSKGPYYVTITVREVKEVVSLPFNVKTSLHVDNNTIISRRLTSEEIKKLRSRASSPKEKEIPNSAKPIVKKSVLIDKEEEKEIAAARRCLDFLGQFRQEQAKLQEITQRRIKESRRLGGLKYDSNKN